MTPVVASELRKLRFTRSLWGIAVAGVAIAAAGAVVMTAAGKDADVADRLSQLGPLRFGPTNFGLLLVLLGIRLFADETHHRTLSATLTRTPHRVRVTVAKAIVAAAAAGAFCVAVDVVTIPVVAVGVAVRGWGMTYDVAASAAMLGRVLAAMSLLAVLGVAFGAAVRNRTVALVSVVVWFALGEDLVGAVLHVDRFLPGAAVTGFVSNTSTSTHLAGAASAALLLVYVVGCAAVAGLALRRDVT